MIRHDKIHVHIHVYEYWLRSLIIAMFDALLALSYSRVFWLFLSDFGVCIELCSDRKFDDVFRTRKKNTNDCLFFAEGNYETK